MNTNFETLSATIDATSKTAFIHVDGTVMIYQDVKNVHFVKSVPQGIIENELILDLVYDLVHPAMKGKLYSIERYSEMVLTTDRYKTVRVRIPNGEDKVVEVVIIQ
jgi:hypothetical protein